MASAIAKPVDNKKIAEYMEHLSTCYFSQIFPNASVSIEPKDKAGKQGGHVVAVAVDSSKSVSTDIIVKRFYVKPQDRFVIPSTSPLPSKLTDVEELFVYKFLSNINLTSSVHFYVDQKRPDCLLIATADGSTNTEERYLTTACYPLADLQSIKMKQIILIQIIEIIFCLKDLISNQHNFGWLYPSKKLFIIDFSIDENQIIKASPPLSSSMLTDKMKTGGRLPIDKHISTFNDANHATKRSFACSAIEPLIDLFVEGIDPTFESIDDFIRANSYAFDGDIETVRLKLRKLAERTRTRWEELIKSIELKNEYKKLLLYCRTFQNI